MQLCLEFRKTSMKNLSLILIGFALLACTPKEKPATAQKDVTVEWTVAPKPAKIGPLQLTLQVKDKDGKPVRATLVNVEGNMTHPGMVPLHAKAQEVKIGEYAAILTLNMAGDWILMADIKLPDGSVVQKSLNLLGVK